MNQLANLLIIIIISEISKDRNVQNMPHIH